MSANKMFNISADLNMIQKFSALGDSTRFKLLKLLQSDDNPCVSQLAAEINISNAGVSQQLKILEQAGIIKRVRQGQKICYQLNYDDPSNKKLLEIL